MLSQLTAIYFEQSARSKGPDPPLLGPSALGLACVSCRVWVQLSAAHLDYDCDSRSAQPRGLLHGFITACEHCASLGLYAHCRPRPLSAPLYNYTKAKANCPLATVGGRAFGIAFGNSNNTLPVRTM